MHSIGDTVLRVMTVYVLFYNNITLCLLFYFGDTPRITTSILLYEIGAPGVRPGIYGRDDFPTFSIIKS